MKKFTKYFIALLITIAIFAGAWYASIYFNNRKLNEITVAQNQATVDVLSSETQFDLLQEASCQDYVSNDQLASEISDLADKITYGEQNFSDQTQLNLLKQQYSVLEVKDFLLTKQISQRCKQNVVTILYFYGNDTTCTDCVNQGYVLDALRQQYPSVRVYSFDAGLDSSTIRALLTVYKVSKTLPTLVIDGKTYSGFMNLAAVEKALPTTLTNPAPTSAKATASQGKPAATASAAVKKMNVSAPQ
jgi:glutaredoxin-related protein